MLEATRLRMQSAELQTKMRVGAAKSKQGSKIDTYIVQEYKALTQQLNELDKNSSVLAKQMKDDTHWYGDDDGKADVQQQLTQIETQRQILTQQFQMLQQKDQAFQGSGIIAKPEPATGPGGAKIHDFTQQ